VVAAGALASKSHFGLNQKAKIHFEIWHLFETIISNDISMQLHVLK